MTEKFVLSRWPGPEFHANATFRAPLDFVFAWCTDYTPIDAALEREAYERKIIERTARRVVFEDLEDSESGWDWSRATVTLSPPSRWHMDAVGNNRDVVADYVLSRMSGGRTRLDLSWKRKPKVPDAKRRTKAEREASATRAWRHFATAKERDYRKSQTRAGRRGQ